MSTQLSYRIIVEMGLLVLAMTGGQVFAENAEESTELSAFSVTPAVRPNIDMPKVEIERPTLDFSQDFAIETVKPTVSLDFLKPPLLGLSAPTTKPQANQANDISTDISTTHQSGDVPRANKADAGVLEVQANNVEKSTLDRDIRPLQIEAPAFPREAALAGATGYVVVEFTVSPEGKTTDIKILEAKPRKMFERSARAAVARWTFEPAMAGGQAISRRVQQRLNFDLN